MCIICVNFSDAFRLLSSPPSLSLALLLLVVLLVSLALFWLEHEILQTKYAKADVCAPKCLYYCERVYVCILCRSTQESKKIAACLLLKCCLFSFILHSHPIYSHISSIAKTSKCIVFSNNMCTIIVVVYFVKINK